MSNTAPLVKSVLRALPKENLWGEIARCMKGGGGPFVGVHTVDAGFIQGYVDVVVEGWLKVKLDGAEKRYVWVNMDAISTLEIVG